MNFVRMMFFPTTSRGCPCFSYMAKRKQGSMTAIIAIDARLVPVLSLSRKKSGSRRKTYNLPFGKVESYFCLDFG